MTKPAVIVSDLHLGAAPAGVRAAFVAFLRAWQGRCETLLINGDLFDFWFEYRTVVLSQHFQVLRALAALRESEVRVVLVGGNHDAWGGAFLEREVGMELVDGPVEMILGGRKALVAHGDGIGPGDTGYKILKRTLRSRAVRRLMRWVHPDLAGRIVRLISHTGVMSEERLRKSRETARVLEEEATRLLSLRPDLELVVFGHCHVPRLKQVGARAYYVNSGDWLVNRTYTLVTAESIEQLEWQEPFTAQPAGASQ